MREGKKIHKSPWSHSKDMYEKADVCKRYPLQPQTGGLGKKTNGYLA